jgi:hypothetical protein
MSAGPELAASGPLMTPDSPETGRHAPRLANGRDVRPSFRPLPLLLIVPAEIAHG